MRLAPFARLESNITLFRSASFARSVWSLTMLRWFFSFRAGVLALFCGTGVTGQLHAQGARGNTRLRGLPQTNRRTPGTDRQFTNPRMAGFNPRLDRRLLALRFSGFIPDLDPLFIDPRFGQRLLDHRSREF